MTIGIIWGDDRDGMKGKSVVIVGGQSGRQRASRPDPASVAKQYGRLMVVAEAAIADSGLVASVDKANDVRFTAQFDTTEEAIAFVAEANGETIEQATLNAEQGAQARAEYRKNLRTGKKVVPPEGDRRNRLIRLHYFGLTTPFWTSSYFRQLVLGIRVSCDPRCPHMGEDEMSEQNSSERRESQFISGYIENRIAKGDRRHFGYPENGLRARTLKSLPVKSCILVALDQADK